MLRYIIRRLLYAMPILLGVSLVTFLLFYASASPQQIARRNLSAKNPTPQQIDEWIHQHGYDKPRWQQFEDHMAQLFLLRLGKSDANGEDIWERIRTGAPASLLLATIAFFGALLMAISLALAMAYFRGTYIDVWGTFLCVLMMSLVYLVYIIAGQFLLGNLLKIFPLAGYRPGIASWKFVVLPALVSIVDGLGSTVRLYRTFVLDEMSQDYVRTARAKGVSERAILFRHVLQNAAIPILTTTAATIPTLFLGSLLGESFFDIPGLGSYLRDAIDSQDFAVVRAMVFLGTITTIIGYLLTDLCYTLLDPRVRLE